MKCPKCRFVGNNKKSIKELHPVNDIYVYRPKTPLRNGKCNCVHCSNCGGSYCRACRNPCNHMGGGLNG